jgi:hypothetical protein
LSSCVGIRAVAAKDKVLRQGGKKRDAKKTTEGLARVGINCYPFTAFGSTFAAYNNDSEYCLLTTFSRITVLLLKFQDIFFTTSL